MIKILHDTLYFGLLSLSTIASGKGFLDIFSNHEFILIGHWDMSFSLMTMFLLILLGLNLVTFVMMGYDKYLAQKHKWRIPEKFLLLLGLFGGGFGGLLGIFIFNHKIRKHYFLVIFLFGILLIFFCYYQYFASVQ